MMAQAQFFYKDTTAPRPNRPNHIGTCILIVCEKKLLLEHRTDSDMWALIGGGLKLDERLADGVIRETFEETGIRLQEKNIEIYNIYDDPSRIVSYPDGNVLRIITVVYKARLTKVPELVCSSESRELKFFSREELRRTNIAATHIPIIEDYLISEFEQKPVDGVYPPIT